MKKSILLGLGAVAMAMGVGAGLAINGFEAPVEAAAETSFVPESGKIYFNVSEFGPTDANEKPTTYSVYASDSTWTNKDWIAVGKVTHIDEYGLISIDDDPNYHFFIVVRAKNGVYNTWPSDSADSYNQTSNIEKTGKGDNYVWIWGTEDNFGKGYTWKSVKGDVSLEVNGSAAGTFKYNFTNNEYVLTDVNLSAGQKLLIDNGSELGYDDLQDDETEGDCRGWFAEGSSGEIEIIADGSYSFYLKESGKIWAQISAETEATTWANTFLGATVCTNSGLVDPTFKGKNPDGNDWTWALLGNAFNALTDGAKDTLNSAGADLDPGTNKNTIANAVARYDWIVRNHSASFSKFIHDHNGNYRAGIVDNGSIGLGSSQKNTAIIVSLLALTGIAGAGAMIFVAKKRKEN